MNADERKVTILAGEEKFQCEVIVDRMQLEHVLSLILHNQVQIKWNVVTERSGVAMQEVSGFIP